jgi:hypothetical protein
MPVRPAIPEKPKAESLERQKVQAKTTENIDGSLVETEQVIPAIQLKETLEIELENWKKPELPAKPATFKEDVAGPHPQMQLKRTIQQKPDKTAETGKVSAELRKDLKPIPAVRKEEVQEQRSEVKHKPVPVKVSEQLLSSGEPLKPQPDQLVERATTAEVGEALERAPVGIQPEIKTSTPWRKPALPANAEPSTTFQPESFTIQPSNLPSEKSGDKLIKQETEIVPEVVLKRTPQKKKPEESEPESVQLKKIPLKSPVEGQDQTVYLKPIPRPKEDEKPVEVVLKRTPQKAKPEEAEAAEIKLKKVPVKPTELPEKPEIRLKPVALRKGDGEAPVEAKQLDAGSIQRDIIPQQTKESITLAKMSPDRTGPVAQLATPTQVDPVKTLPESVHPEISVSNKEVPWRKKVIPQVPDEMKEKIDAVPVIAPSKPDETPETSIPTSAPADVKIPQKGKDVPLVEAKINLKPVIPARKIEPESVPEVAVPIPQILPVPEPEETKLTGIVLAKPQEVPKILDGGKTVKRSPREPESAPIPQQVVVLKRTPQKPKAEEPEPEIVKLKKIPQPEAASSQIATPPESQSINIPTSVPVKVPPAGKDVPVVTKMILKPVVPAAREMPEPVVATQVTLKPTPQIRKPEEVQSMETLTVIPAEIPKIPEGSKSVRRSPREPDVIPIQQQVVLKRTPQKPKAEEPEPEMIKLKKIPQPEVPEVAAVVRSEIPISFSSDRTEVSIESIPESKIDVSPSWRKPRTPSVTPSATPMEEKPLQPEVVQDVSLISEQFPSDDQTSVTRLKRTQRQYIPDISEATTSAPIQPVELKPIPVVLDEPASPVTLTASVKSVQLKRPDVPAVQAVTTESRTEISKVLPDQQTVSITTTKISQTSTTHRTEMVQPPSPEEKSTTRLPKMKASIAMAPKFQAPVFTKKLQPLSSRTGKKVRLHCQFQGEPLPTITWYRNESVLLPTADRLDITTEPASSVLEISQIVLEDTGIYTCRAVNEAGSAITSANFIVQG